MTLGHPVATHGLLARSERRRRSWSLAGSLTLHLGALVAALLGPSIRAGETTPLEFVPVEIVPAAALGARLPKAEPPSRPEASEPAPVPEPTAKRAASEAAPDRSTAPPPAPERRQREGVPTGSSLGVSSFGAAVAGLDNPEFTYDYYITQMLAMIRSEWVRPPLGGSVEAALHYRIERDGGLRSVQVVRSSGYSSFDLAALRAVRAAAPFPPLPRAYRHGSLGVTLIVR